VHRDEAFKLTEAIALDIESLSMTGTYSCEYGALEVMPTSRVDMLKNHSRPAPRRWGGQEPARTRLHKCLRKACYMPPIFKRCNTLVRQFFQRIMSMNEERRYYVRACLVTMNFGAEGI